ncbi:MAG: type II secretion system secretin GspD [Caulobacteraceae bacterium]|nr:type II secretion system secretin GspD [Caulobacteraceae bacterium]
MSLRALSLGALFAATIASGMAAGEPASPPDGPEVRSTILPGSPPAIVAPPRPVEVLPSGDVSLNFPSVEVGVAAKAILGDTLGLSFSVDPSAHGSVTVVTPHPIRRADVLAFFEQALTNADLVLASRAGAYVIVPAAAARGEAAAVGPSDPGYGNETIVLHFVNAEQMRKLLDPLVPNAISVADPATNTLIVSGDGTQRKALRDLVAEFDVDWLRGMSFALFVPQRTDARLIAPELEKLLNSPGAPTAGLVRLIAMNQLNGILAISAQPQYLEDVKRFVEILDREGEGAEKAVFVYKVQNGRAADLAKVLNSAFGTGSGGGGGATGAEAPELVDHTAPSAATLPPPAAGVPAMGAPVGPGSSYHPDQGAAAATGGAMTITADETNNAVVVYATPRNYAMVENALRKLDVPPLQVMIDASISEVTLNHSLQYGIQWSVSAGKGAAALTQGTTSTPVRNFPGFSYIYDGVQVQATLNALKTVTDVTVLSAPKLVVLNNHTATIEVGDQVPVATGSAVSTLQTGAPIVNSIEYRDTGVILKITPRVNSGGLVLLDIAQEVSDVLTTTPAQVTSGLTSPTIEQRKIATSVAVQDGQTIALGGLIKNEVQKGRSTVPLFGDIPVLGHLFGDTTGGLVRTELVVLLTPRVVRAPVDVLAVTRELRDNIHLAAPPPPVQRPPANASKD